jgi:hypothetical protein
VDRKYIKEHLSAYLDGELAPKEMREFEREVQSYPDLFAELQTLQRLNKLALDSKVPLPTDAYFDELAGRIDARIKRESPQDRSKVINFLLERRKTVAIISSVAAMFLIAVIGMNMFGPGAKKYPSEIRTIELKPAIVTTPKKDTVALWPQYEPNILPPPIVEEENQKTEPTRENRIKLSKKDVSESVGPDTITHPTQSLSTAAQPPVPSPDTVKSEAHIVIAERDILQSAPKGNSSVYQLQGLSNSSVSSSASSKAANLTATADIVLHVDSITISTETILPPAQERRMTDSAEPTRAPIEPDTARLRAATGRDWDVYAQVFKKLDQGIFFGWKLSAPTSSRDSLQAWKDSLIVLGPARWYAEQAFRSIQSPASTWEDFQRCRAYIDFYLADPQIPDLYLWNGRQDTIAEILEHHLGKIYQEKK